MEVRHRLTRGTKRWFILTGVFFVSFLETGTVRSFGVILNDLTSEFGTSTAYIGTIIGMAHGATYWLSVLNTPLLRRFSVRQVVMAGGLIGSLGLILSAFAMTGSLFAAALFMFGIGFSTVVLPANSSPVDYFPDLFEIASSINLTGGGVGLMILPLLFEVFVTSYGWRGALMLLGAINLNTLVSGALLEPVPKAEESAAGELPLDNTMDVTERERKMDQSGHCSSEGARGSVEEGNGTTDFHVDSEGGTNDLIHHDQAGNGNLRHSVNTNTNCKSDGKVLIHRISDNEDAAPNGYTTGLGSEVENSDSKHHHELEASYNTGSNSISVKEAIASEDFPKDNPNRTRSGRWCHSIAELFTERERKREHTGHCSSEGACGSLEDENGTTDFHVDSEGGANDLIHHDHAGNGNLRHSVNTNTDCKSDGKVLIRRISDTEDAAPNGYTTGLGSDVENSDNKHHHELEASYNTGSNSISVTEAIASEDFPKDNPNCMRSGRWCHSIAELFDLYIFKDHPAFFGICLATILFGVSYDGWVLFVIPNAEAKGFDSQMSVYVATAGGVGNIFGRFCIGFFTAKQFIPNEVSYLIMNVLSSVAFFINYGATTFWFLSLLSFLNGFSLGAKTSLQFIIVNGCVATERYKAAVSMLLVSLGIGFPISGALLGGIYDRTKSYNISFCVIGLIDVICGILITAPLIAAVIRRRKSRDSSPREVSI